MEENKNEESTSNAKVLLVDHNDLFMEKILRNLFKKYFPNYTCNDVECSEDALELLTQTKYDLIVTSGHLDGSDRGGITFAQSVKENYPETHVIITSSLQSIVEEAEQKGIGKAYNRFTGNITELKYLLEETLQVKVT